MELAVIMWAGVIGTIIAHLVQTAQEGADRQRRWREACLQEQQEAIRRQEERAQYEEARRMEREAFYAGHHRIKPDGWNERPTMLERSDHERLMDWRGW